MEMHISDYLQNTRVPEKAHKSWRKKKILEIREHIETLVRLQNIMASDTTASLSDYDEQTLALDSRGYNSNWITQGWMNDRYVEYDEDFSDLFNLNSPGYDIIKDIQRLKT